MVMRAVSDEPGLGELRSVGRQFLILRHTRVNVTYLHILSEMWHTADARRIHVQIGAVPPSPVDTTRKHRHQWSFSSLAREIAGTDWAGIATTCSHLSQTPTRMSMAMPRPSLNGTFRKKKVVSTRSEQQKQKALLFSPSTNIFMAYSPGKSSSQKPSSHVDWFSQLRHCSRPEPAWPRERPCMTSPYRWPGHIVIWTCTTGSEVHQRHLVEVEVLQDIRAGL